LSSFENLLNILCEYPKVDSKEIYSSFLNILDISKYLASAILTPNVKTCEKRAILREITRHYEKIERTIMHLITSTLSFELGLEFLKNVCLVGFDIQFNRLGEKIIDTLKMNPDLLAGLTDVLIETGYLNLAYNALRILLNNRYNIMSVLLNLAIVSYLLGYPRVAMMYIRVYEKLAKTKSKLRIPLSIALGEYR